MLEPIYVERQNFSPWVYGILLTTGVLGLFVALPEMGGEATAGRFLAGFTMVGISAILLNVLCMTVRVLPDEVTIHFGRTFYFYSKHIGMDEIRRVEVIEYQPIRESGGWGIRWGRHDGRKARYFSARGTRAVLLDTDKGLMIIGTPTPEKLAAAVAGAGRAPEADADGRP